MKANGCLKYEYFEEIFTRCFKKQLECFQRGFICFFIYLLASGRVNSGLKTRNVVCQHKISKTPLKRNKIKFKVDGHHLTCVTWW